MRQQTCYIKDVEPYASPKTTAHQKNAAPHGARPTTKQKYNACSLTAKKQIANKQHK
jgi:hypothetical protein